MGQSNRIIKLTIFSNCIVLIFLLFIGHNAPAAGYELNYYESTPIIIWFLLFINITSSLSIAIILLANPIRTKFSLLITDIVIILLSRITFLLLPHIRGYYSWHGDNITQLGLLKDILFFGNFSQTNFYPISHTLLAEITLVLNIESQFVSNIAPITLSTLFPLFMYVLTKSLFKCDVQRVICLIISSSILIGGVYNVFFMPNGFSIFLLPLAMYLLLNRGHPSYLILLLSLIVIYPYFHPLSSLFIISTILILWGASRLGNFLIGQPRYSSKSLLMRNPIPFILLETIILITWVLSFNAFDNNARNLINNFTNGGPEALGRVGNTLNYIGIEKWETVALFLKLYGATFFMILLSILGLCFLIVRVLKNNLMTIGECRMIGFGSVFIVSGLIYTIYLLGVPALENIGAERLLTYSALFTPIFTGITLHKIMINSGPKTFKTLMVLVLISFPIITSWISLYPSPYIYKPNAQISNQDIAGTQWLFNSKIENIPTLLTLSNQPRLVEGIFGKSNAELTGFIDTELNQVPDHFNFDGQLHECKNENNNCYLSLSMIDLVVFCKWEFPTIAKLFPQAPVGNFSLVVSLSPP